MSQQEGECVSQADLRERVFKGEVGLRAPGGAQEDAEEDEDEASPNRVRQLVTEALPFFGAAVDGIRQGDADQKREAGLDGVVKSHACPFDVGLVEGEDAPEHAMRKGAGDLGEAHHFAHHQQHDQPAIGVDGHVARRRGRDRRTNGWRRLDLVDIRGDCCVHSVPHRLENVRC